MRDAPRLKNDTVTKQVGIWIRVSTEDQARGESPEHHERRAHAYAESKDWRVREVYHLEAVSGKSVMGHAETEKMLRHVRSGHITGLIFSKLARLARNTRELLDFADIFRENDADLISLQEAIDTTTPAGRLFYTMIAAMAQWEREEISERVAASVPIRAKLGKPTGGAAPFGYQWENRRLVLDPKEAPVRRLLHELFLEHKRKRTVARILNEKGYRTRKGAKFSGTTVDRLLKDPTAKGKHRANYTKSLGEGKKWVLKSESEWVYIDVEPIIPEDLWNQCNAILEEQSRNGRRRGRKPSYLFTGLVFCHCGRKMYVSTDSRDPKYICRECRNKIPTKDLEAVFHEQLREFFFSPEEVSSYLQTADETIGAKQEALTSLESELKRVETEMEGIYQLYLKDGISPEGFGRKYKPLEERQKQIEAEIPKLQGEVDFLKIQFLSRDEILSEAKDLFTRWPHLEFHEKQQIIENIVQEVRIGKNDIEFRLIYIPSPSEMAGKKARNLRDSSPPREGKWRESAGRRSRGRSGRSLPRAAGGAARARSF
ncbi:MAG: recombinase family protein [Candidatus Eisenbacteria bacterium]|nr:recombinase family protein [Candidatus Eisenbacteria bacterium]